VNWANQQTPILGSPGRFQTGGSRCQLKSCQNETCQLRLGKVTGREEPYSPVVHLPTFDHAMNSAVTRLLVVLFGLLVATLFQTAGFAEDSRPRRSSPSSVVVALVQFDAVPEAIDRNLMEMDRLVRAAVDRGARWIQFHEGCVSDYTPQVKTLAELVPEGKSTQRMISLAAECDCYIAFGINERNEDRFHISQVFVGPQGLVHCYRKTWLHRTNEDKGYRNELARYDPGTGPSLFEIDGVRAACFICADATSPRCIERLRDLQAEVVFHPNNHINPSPKSNWKRKRELTKEIGAPVLVSNRVGHSWMYSCEGGCGVISATGELLAQSNSDGREEILIWKLKLPRRFAP
jgi:predicted amidohydrolase